MSRVIKFRAYVQEYLPHKEAATMVYSDKLGGVGFFFNNFEDDPVMQFTGLLDVNGVEIYEGDIVEITYKEDGAKSPMQVVFEKAQFYLKGDGFWTLSSNAVTLLVIGNIYQNPELLK